MLTLDSVAIGLGARSFGPFTLQVAAGERVAILGPSGAGKSTLLKLMSGECKPAAGQVLFHGQSLSEWRLHDLSRLRAVLPQSSEVAFGFETDLVIGLGRVAQFYDPKLTAIVKASATLAHAQHLLARRFDTLSGGEKARIQLARVLAQLWDVRDGLVLVDEPLAALDPGLQCDLLDSLDTYASQRNHALVAILHDINQALHGFDRLLLVKEGRLFADLSSSAHVVPALEELYGIALNRMTDEQGALVVTPMRRITRRPLAQEASQCVG